MGKGLGPSCASFSVSIRVMARLCCLGVWSSKTEPPGVAVPNTPPRSDLGVASHAAALRGPPSPVPPPLRADGLAPVEPEPRRATLGMQLLRGAGAPARNVRCHGSGVGPSSSQQRGSPF